MACKALYDRLSLYPCDLLVGHGAQLHSKILLELFGNPARYPSQEPVHSFKAHIAEPSMSGVINSSFQYRKFQHYFKHETQGSDLHVFCVPLEITIQSPSIQALWPGQRVAQYYIRWEFFSNSF